MKAVLMFLEAAAITLSLIANVQSEELDLSILDFDQVAAFSSTEELDLSILGCGPVANEPVEELDLTAFGLVVPAMSRNESLDLTILGIETAAPLIKPRSSSMLEPKPTDAARIELQKFAPGQPQLQSCYPTHPQRWNVAGNWNPSREQLVAHLMGGQHAGKFTAAYLNGLSIPELKSLHDDDHEGRVQTGYVKQVAMKPVAPAVTPAATTVRYASPCPGGRCPTYSYGYTTTKRSKGIAALFSRR